MNLQERMQQVATIKENIQQKISQNYLMKFIDEPYIDEDRILMLIESLMAQNLSHSSINQFVTTAMLIQIALDTHDKVNNSNEPLKQRQLTVLAGDYYSGLYYKILAEVENVPLIRALAEGIKLVNEYKITLYRIEDENIDGYLHTVKKAESTIASKFIHFFGSKTLSVLNEELMLFNKLILEKEKVEDGKSSQLFEALKKYLLPISDLPFQQLSKENKLILIEACQEYINKSGQAIKEAMERIKLNQLLEQRVLFLLNQHSKTTLFLEEG
ncbi:hypothetical protein J6TS2_20460 [Heyndrickxia sporothermodurans]|nr:hypothetical protein J6TS2_20460 [Heyndrickxia sporothermodurans]